MTQALVQAVVSLIISLALEIVPWLKDQWNAWQWKTGALVALSGVVAAIWWALSCYTTLTPDTGLVCNVEGAVKALVIGILSGYGGSQLTWHVAAKRTPNALKRNG